MTALTQYSTNLTRFTRPLTQTAYADLFAFVNANIDAFLPADYQTVFSLLIDVCETATRNKSTADITPMINSIVEHLSTKLTAGTNTDVTFVISVSIMLISITQVRKDVFGDLLSNTDFPYIATDLLDDIIEQSETKVLPSETKFNAAVLLTSLVDATPYVNFIDNTLADCKRFITVNRSDIESGFEVPARIVNESNPYLVKHYINNNIEESYERRREEACKILETYGLLLGVAMRTPTFNIRPYHLPIDYIPILHELFDELSDDYDVDFELEYLLLLVKRFTEDNEEALEEAVEYIQSLAESNDYIYVTLLQRLTF